MRVGLIQCGWRSYKTETFRQTDRETHTSPVTVRAEVGVTHLPAKELRRLRANHRKPEDRQEQTPITLEGPLPAESLVLDFQPPERRFNTFLLLKPPSLWSEDTDTPQLLPCATLSALSQARPERLREVLAPPPGSKGPTLLSGATRGRNVFARSPGLALPSPGGTSDGVPGTRSRTPPSSAAPSSGGGGVTSCLFQGRLASEDWIHNGPLIFSACH